MTTEESVLAFLAETAEIGRKYGVYIYADGGLYIVTYDTGMTLHGPVEMRCEKYQMLRLSVAQEEQEP